MEVQPVAIQTEPLSLEERRETGAEKHLKIHGWTSEYKSVENVLRHLYRKTQSVGSRRHFAEIVTSFCKFLNTNPDGLMALKKEEAEEEIQRYLDTRLRKNISLRKIRADRSYLLAFFKVNGFRNERSLEVQTYSVPARYRKKPEYIPTFQEVMQMCDAAESLKHKAIVLWLATTGLRNSTLRALRYGDIKDEYEQQTTPLLVPVYPEMRRIVAGACKNKIPYFTFTPIEAVDALTKYLAERQEKTGKIEGDHILFATEDSRIPRHIRPHMPLTKDAVAKIVKSAARRADIKRWKDITPHSLRKVFENTLREARLDTKDQEFLMGHLLEGSQDAYYGAAYTFPNSTVSFSQKHIEYLRAQYKNTTFQHKYDPEEIKREATLEALKAAWNLDQEGIRKIQEALKTGQPDWSKPRGGQRSGRP